MTEEPEKRKVELNLAKPIAEAMAKLFERLTGKKLPPDQLKRLTRSTGMDRTRPLRSTRATTGVLLPL